MATEKELLGTKNPVVMERVRKCGPLLIENLGHPQALSQVGTNLHGQDGTNSVHIKKKGSQVQVRCAREKVVQKRELLGTADGSTEGGSTTL